MTKQNPPVSKALPFDLRAALVRAAAIKDPMERLKAIEQVERLGRLRCPKLFQPLDGAQG